MMLAITAIIRRYQTNERSMHILLLFACVHLIMELTSDYVNYILKQNNLIFYHIFAPVGYSILSIFFYYSFNSYKLRKAVMISIPIYWLIAFWLSSYVEQINQLNAIAYMSESILIIYWCFSFFKELLKRKEIYRPEGDRKFWTVVGILTYFIGNFFTTGTLNYFVSRGDSGLVTDVYYAGYAFNFLFYGTIFLVNSLPFSKSI